MSNFCLKIKIIHFLAALEVLFLANSSPASSNEKNESVFEFNPIVITAEKRSQELQATPLSISVLPHVTLQDSGISSIKEASYLIPNLYIPEFSVRRVNFPFIRGLGSGQGEPVVATYIDGVPQLSPNSTNIELLNIDRIEVIRGPQGALYGRNALGGVIHIITENPSPEKKVFTSMDFGEYSLQRYLLSLDLPLVEDELYFGLSGLYGKRDGHNENRVTGNDVDDQETLAARAKLRLIKQNDWDISMSIYGERDNDGDYVLFDLESLRKDPHRVRHDFEGKTERDIVAPTLSITHYGETADFVSITGYEFSSALDLTDLDASEADFLRRKTDEKQHQLYQELRLQSGKETAIEPNDWMSLQWLTGVTFFHSNFEHESYDEFRPAIAPLLPHLPPEFFPFRDLTEYELEDLAIGLSNHLVLTLAEQLDLNFALRIDYEHRDVEVNLVSNSTFRTQTIEFDRDFTELLPKLGLNYRWNNHIMTYLHAAKGFRTGGFNRNANPGGNFEVDEEESWTYEAGIKTNWFAERLTFNMAFFHIDWEDMQLDVSDPEFPSRFFLDNVGEAESNGFEAEFYAQVDDHWKLFAGFGYTAAEFNDYFDPVTSRDVEGNELPNVPEYTWNCGIQNRFVLNSKFYLFARAEVVGVGKRFFDNANSESQNGYTLANFRMGMGGEYWSLVAWIRNAFDEEYVSIAFPTLGGGFIGRSGTPQTVGITLKFEM